MRVYSVRNFIIAFLILLAIVLIVLFNIFSNFRSQKSELSKIQNSRQILQTLEPVLINIQEFKNDLYDLIVFDKDKYAGPYIKARKELQNDLGSIAKLTAIDPENSNKYERILKLTQEITGFADTIIHSHETGNFDTLKNEWIKNYPEGIISEFKIIVDTLKINSRKILTNSYNLSAGLAREIFVFTGIISILLVLALIFTFLVSYRDITVRKKAEVRLKKFNEELERQVNEKTAGYFGLIDTIDGIVWEADPQTFQFSFVSKQAERLLGYSIEQWIKEPTFWVDHIHPDDKTWAIEYCIQNTVAKRPHEFEYRMITSDGRTVWLRDIVTVMVENDRTIKLRGVMVDITEWKRTEKEMQESEERYKALVETAPEALVVFDVEMERFTSVSESALKLFKMTREELLRIGPLALSPEYQPDGMLSSEIAKTKIKDALDGNKPVFEWIHCDATGKLIPCEVWLVRLPSEKNVLIRGSIIDITERKKAQNDLEQSYKSIRQLTEHLQNVREEERIAIAREIHDELGQQLTILKMDISWLKKKLQNSDIETEKKVDDVFRMTDATIKSVRKISSELRPSLLDDLGLVATIEWHLKEFGSRSGIKTSFTAIETEMELPGTIKTTLFRIFQESLTNVARHAEATKVKVSLRHEDGAYILNITDDGKGFDQQKIADKRTLGLLGMKERTAMTGGNYDIFSTPGEGTTISVTIPLSDNN